MFVPFQLPHELLITTLFTQYACRGLQIRALATLLSPLSPSPRNIVLYGTEATGKSCITESVLSALCSNPEEEDIENDTLQYAIVKSEECITGRHLLETTVGAVAKATGWQGPVNRCENLAQLVVEISRLLDGRPKREDADGGEALGRRRFVLVFDGVDRQKDAPPTLLQALARIGEVVPDLTTIFIVTAPRPHFLHIPGVPHIHFPSYTKSEAIQILSLNPPTLYPRSSSTTSTSPSPSPLDDEKSRRDSKEVWNRFTSAVWDTLSKHSGRDILSFRSTCDRLWIPFTTPIREGLYTPKDFHRLLIAKRPLLQDESTLIPAIVSAPIPPKAPTPSTTHLKPSSSITTQLPTTSRLLLIAAYLASHTPARLDPQLFTTHSTKSRRRKGGRPAGLTPTKPRAGTSKSRKISRKLLGPQAFVQERLLAIFHALRLEADVRVRGWGSGSADTMMGMATLASLRLVVRTSAGGDALDGAAKWKVNVGWEVVRAVARSVGVEVEDFVVD